MASKHVILSRVDCRLSRAYCYLCAVLRHQVQFGSSKSAYWLDWSLEACKIYSDLFFSRRCKFPSLRCCCTEIDLDADELCGKMWFEFQESADGFRFYGLCFQIWRLIKLIHLRLLFGSFTQNLLNLQGITETPCFFLRIVELSLEN